MRFFLCDDDNSVIIQLRSFIDDYFSINGFSQFEILIHNNSGMIIDGICDDDIVFFDIAKEGIDALRSLKNKNHSSSIIVISSDYNYLDDAMGLGIFRYLLKPIDTGRLERTISDAISVCSSNSHQLAVETRDGVYNINDNSILYIESYDHKTTIHTLISTFISTRTLEYWESRLNKSVFCRTHKSFIVNLSKISDFDRSTIHFNPYNGYAYLTKRRYPVFKQQYSLYMERCG